MLDDAPLAYALLSVVLATSVIGFWYRGLASRMALYPYEVVRMQMVYGVFTAPFVHTGWGHLAGNLFFAVFFVPEVEYMLVDDFDKPGGSLVFLLVFFAMVLFSSTVAVARYRANARYSNLGLSAVVFGMISFFYFYLPLDKSPVGGVISGDIHAYQVGCLGMAMLGLAIRYKVARAAPIHFYGAVGGLVVAICVRPKLLGEIIAHVAGASL